MASVAGKTILMSGGSRGIGLAIALRAARDGADIAVLAKTAQPHAKLPGTVYSAAAAIPALRASARTGRNPHILTLSPPLNLAPRWVGAHLGYTIAKYGMSLTVGR